MNVYFNSRTDSKIASIESTTLGNRQLNFIHLRDATAMDAVKSWLLQSPESTLLSETNNNNKPILVVSGTQSPTDILRILREHGETLQAPAPEKKKFNPWAWRAGTSMLGQSLQVLSSFTSIPNDSPLTKADKDTGDKWSIFGFATLNLIANCINYFYGAQEKNDPNHLQYLKEQFNAQLQPHVTANSALPSPNHNPLEERGKNALRQEKKDLSFWEKYSVSLGEIGLRTLGSLSLVFPATKIPEAFRTFRSTSSITQAFSAAKNPNKNTVWVGMAMLTGKFVSLLSKEPDPYSEKPPTWLDWFREKVTFKLSSVIEGGAATWMTYDRLRFNRSVWGQKAVNAGAEPSIWKHSDLLGAAGNIVFMGGYGIRFTAPYGTREVNMRELYAHLSEGLAKVEPEKLPQLVLETAIGLHQHFKDKPANKKNPLDLPSIYARLVDELEQYHHIKLDAPSPAPAPPILADTKTASPHSSITGKKTLSHAAIENTSEIAAHVR